MKRRFLAVSLLALVAACAGENVTPPTTQPAFDAAASGATRYIVVFRDNIAGAQAVTNQVLPLGTAADYVYSASIKGFAARMSPQAAEQLRLDPRVKYVEVDRPVSIHITQSPAPAWGLDRVDQRNLPLSSSYTYNNTGSGVHFYGIDTGILGTHLEFTGRMGNGFNATGLSGGTKDCNGHGTHTASTAAGTTYGVAKGMTVHPVRVLDCTGSGTYAMVIAGIDWVTHNHLNPAVANMSLGGGFHQATNDAVTASIASGVVYSISSGNSNADACGFTPASTPTAITVNASEINDARASFSNFGSCTDIFAPGVNIRAAWIGSSNTATTTISGTSMAAPHVAGVAGLYLQANPGATPAQVASALIINATVNKVTSSGSGSPNRLLFMGFIGGGPPPPVNLSPTANFTWNCVRSGTYRYCTFNGTSSSDPDGTIVGYRWVRPEENVLMSTASKFTKTWYQPRTFTVSLTVTDNAGGTGSQTQTITIP